MRDKRKRKLEKAAKQAAAEASAAVEDGLDMTHRLVKTQLKERPGITLGAAALAGLLIGIMLTGRRK